MIFLVYGTLKKGFHNNYLLSNSVFLGEFKTPAKFTMFSLGGFPGVVEKGKTSIHCEAYAVSEKDIKHIYRLEGFTGIKNHRDNWYDVTTLDTPFGKADMFVFKNNPNNDIVKSGNWTN